MGPGNACNVRGQLSQQARNETAVSVFLALQSRFVRIVSRRDAREGEGRYKLVLLDFCLLRSPSNDHRRVNSPFLAQLLAVTAIQAFARSNGELLT